MNSYLFPVFIVQLSAALCYGVVSSPSMNGDAFPESLLVEFNKVNGLDVGPGPEDASMILGVMEQPKFIEDEPNLDQPEEDEANYTGGVVYTRWGRSHCPTGAELVYSGTASGSYFDITANAGGATNYLCLPQSPIYDEYDAGSSTYRALLYSSEYRTSSAPSRLRAVNYHTPSCAVCRAPAGYSNELMVPGRNVCPPGEWRLEYAGYLMSSRYNEKRTKFVCMDREMEAAPGTQGSQGGAYFWMVEGRCIVGGGIPCGPYINGYELTCAVCTI